MTLLARWRVVDRLVDAGDFAAQRFAGDQAGGASLPLLIFRPLLEALQAGGQVASGSCCRRWIAWSDAMFVLIRLMSILRDTRGPLTAQPLRRRVRTSRGGYPYLPAVGYVVSRQANA